MALCRNYWNQVHTTSWSSPPCGWWRRSCTRPSPGSKVTYICGQENGVGDGLGTRLGLGYMYAVIPGWHSTILKEHTILPPPLLPLFCNTASDPILQVGVSWCFVSLKGGTLLQFLWFSHLTVFMAQSQDNCTYFGIKSLQWNPSWMSRGGHSHTHRINS